MKIFQRALAGCVSVFVHFTFENGVSNRATNNLCWWRMIECNLCGLFRTAALRAHIITIYVCKYVYIYMSMIGRNNLVTWCLCACAHKHFFIDLFKSAQHVSGDKFAHPQEHFLNYIQFLIQCTASAADLFIVPKLYMQSKIATEDGRICRPKHVGPI